MSQKLSSLELNGRINKLLVKLKEGNRDFDTAIIAGRVNQYYFTGAMADGLFILKSDGRRFFFVRRSPKRASLESPLGIIYPIASYRDITSVLDADLGVTYLETDLIPLSMLERLKKYFNFSEIHPIEPQVNALRGVKSNYELGLIRRAGRLHKKLLEDIVPGILAEGMSEAEFHGELFSAMMKMGYQGVSRFAMFQTEMVLGQVGFGANSIYPTSFDGPGGMRGQSAASPAAGNRARRLKKDDLVFVDIGFGYEGYHTDKTQVYSFGREVDERVKQIHSACIEVQKRAAELLTPGNAPAEIYKTVMAKLPSALKKGFMGYESSVKFLGHGVGLQIDEPPAIAAGFNDRLAENMVIALEPKCAIGKVGTVGVEETYIVREFGGECVTGGGRDIIVV